MRDFLISSNWWIEGEEAFFWSVPSGVLFQVNIATCQCEFLTRIPKYDTAKCNGVVYCQKYEGRLYCFPYDKEKIYIYDLKSSVWEESKFICEVPLMFNPRAYRNEVNEIWILEHKNKGIFQVSLAQKKVIRQYMIPRVEDICNGQYVLVHNQLYYITGSSVGCIDNERQTNVLYDIEGITFQLYTICHDGRNFWLSGADDKIFIWNPMQGVVKVITDILQGHELPDFEKKWIVPEVPLFNDSILLGEYIWYIPIQDDAPVLYIHKDNHNVQIMKISEEKETEKTLRQRENAFKYRVVYVRKDRYIGVYSIKNQSIFEIDTKELLVKQKNYVISDIARERIADVYHMEKEVLYEANEGNVDIFTIMLQKSFMTRQKGSANKGKSIYDTLR